MTCESAFRVAGVGLCGTQAKVASRVSNYVAARCLWGKWEKVMFCDVRKCISRGRRGTLWHSGKSCFTALWLRRRALSMGKVRKGDVLQRVKVHFAWQTWDFVALRQKLLHGSLITSPRAVYGESEKRWCFVTCESAFRVAGVGLCGTQAKVASRVSNYVAARCLWGKWEKVMFCDVRKCISRGRRGTLWHSSKSCESCFAGL